MSFIFNLKDQFSLDETIEILNFQLKPTKPINLLGLLRFASDRQIIISVRNTDGMSAVHSLENEWDTGPIDTKNVDYLAAGTYDLTCDEFLLEMAVLSFIITGGTSEFFPVDIFSIPLDEKKYKLVDIFLNLAGESRYLLISKVERLQYGVEIIVTKDNLMTFISKAKGEPEKPTEKPRRSRGRPALAKDKIAKIKESHHLYPNKTADELELELKIPASTIKSYWN
jgi:hypothetical protein